MARRTAGPGRIAHAARWALASPRVARALGVYAAVVLAVSVLAVSARSQGGSAPAPGPGFEVAEAAVTRAVPVTEASRSSPEPRARPRARQNGLARPHPTTTLAPKGWAYWAPRIRMCESSGNYRARSSTSTASGAYQILDSTWQGRYGVHHAADASPEQQDRAAAELYRAYGTSIWAASAACWRI
jgi:hypothetical protein